MLKLYTHFIPRYVTFLSICMLIFSPGGLKAQAFATVNNINSVPATATAVTGEKPQSKVWTHDGKWWSVFPSSGNTYLWRLDGSGWTQMIQVATGNAYADCKVNGNATHILLYKGTASQLVTVQYNGDNYQPSGGGPVNITLNSGVETATIDIDATGRMFLAYAGTTSVYVRWSDAPYTTWSNDVTIATGIDDDDIAAVVSLPDRTGVLWSNQTTRRFGFKTISNGANPSDAASWSADEEPASQSAINTGNGMADDHINLKVASDGTLYAAVKTGYDAGGYPGMALLVRRPAGTWDNLHPVTTGDVGTRPIVILNEALGTLKVLYTAGDGGGNILYKQSPLSSISFGPQQTLITGNYNNVTSTKQNYATAIVVLASSSSQVVSVLASDEEDDENENNPIPAGALAGHWQMDEAGGSTLTDASTYNNTATIEGSASRVPGRIGQALQLNGTTQFATVADNASLDITSQITLAAWVKPAKAGTQYIIKKGNGSSANGYELSLSSSGAGGIVFFRFNQNATYRVNSITQYPTNGNTWMHIAGTYDGTSLKIYINGLLEATIAPAPSSIAANNLPLLLGAQNGDASTRFAGALDDARVYNIALSGEQIAALTIESPPATPTLVSPANASIHVPLSTTLSWNEVPSATSYQVQVATSATFAELVHDDANISGTSSSLSGLLNNTTYYWRVNAANTVGTGSWSATNSFTTLPLPASTTVIGAGYALDFDGTNDHVTVPDNNMLDLSSNLTLEAWIKPERTATQRIISKATQGSVDGYELSISSGGAPFVRFNQASTDDGNRVNATTTLQHNTWYHIAATYDGATIRLYVNGRQEGSRSSTISIAANDRPLAFGAQPGASNTYPFGGMIDEVRIWNIAKTDADIKASMSVKLTGTENGLAGYWNLDESEEILVMDRTANGNNGTLVNMTEANRVWSGASLGDRSAFDYDAEGGYSAMLAHADGDVITATTTGGTVTGIQVYQADATPLREGAIIPEGIVILNYRFTGVKVLGAGQPPYTLVYNFGAVEDLSEHASTLRLLKRSDLSDDSWEDAGAILDEDNNTLTVANATGTEYALASTNAALPVTFGPFTARAEGKTVLLVWETLTETNNEGFYIERSTDGINFSTLDFVPSKAGGNNTSKTSYTFADLSPAPGIMYYRLRQVDHDQKASYSAIVMVKMVNVSDPPVILRQLYPNPAGNQIRLSIGSNTATPVTLSIVDVSGRTVISEIRNLAAGNNLLEILLPSLKQGMYFIRILAAGSREMSVHPFIKR